MSTDQATPFSQEPAAPAAPAAPQDPAPAATPAPAFQIPTTVADLIGEGKKYGTVEKALEALKFSQDHIAKLEQENAAYKENQTKVKTAEELLEEIKATANKTEQEPSAPQIDESLIDRIVEQKITAKEQAATAKQNVDSVVGRMTKEFGDSAKAEEVYINKAKELGLSVSALNEMAAKSPTAVFHLFGLAKSESAPAPKPSSSVNTDALANNPPPAPKPKSIMGGAKQAEILDAWRSAAPKE